MGERTADYGFVGTGSITRAMVVGLSTDEQPPAIVLSPRTERVSRELADRFRNVTVASDNQAVVDAAPVVVLACRPGDAAAVLRPLTFAADQALISVVAGVPVADLQALVSPATQVARTIPLPSAAQRRGLVPVVPPLAAALELFSRLGDVVPVETETVFNAFSAASATAALQLDLLATIEAWLVRQGVERPDARSYVAELATGLTNAMTTDTAELAVLADHHATPGGLNEQIRTSLRDHGLHMLLDTALDDVAARVNG